MTEATPSPIDYLLIGTVCVDGVGKRAVLGGSVSYCSVAARNIGIKVGVVTSADFEPRIVDALVGREHLLDPAAPVRIARKPAAETTRFVNTYDGPSRQQLLLATAGTLTLGDVPEEWMNAPVVHLAPLAQDVDPGLADHFPSALLGVTPQGWMRTWDEQSRVSQVPWTCADTMLDRADVVIMSNEDLATPDLLENYSSRARMFILTKNVEGAYVYEKGDFKFRSPAFKPARIGDPSGAGDVFSAVFLCQYWRTGDAERAAAYANCASSFAIEKRAWSGVATLEQIEERLRRGRRIKI